jgi:putative zinc finger/helix-turn-helix YgiT family protein
MIHASAAPLCRACRQGHLHPATFEDVFHPHGQEVRVELLTSRCDHCGAQTTLARQHDENLRRLANRKQHYGQLLMGEEILALRKKYGLSQQVAARIFGKGKIAFCRYENETSYPDQSTTLLLTLAIEHPEVLKHLAEKAGEHIPLWAQRCEDQRRTMRVISLPTKPAQDTTEHLPIDMPAAPTTNSGWQNFDLSRRQKMVVTKNMAWQEVAA